jgi:N-acetylneuraminic acid mutarotase
MIGRYMRRLLVSIFMLLALPALAAGVWAAGTPALTDGAPPAQPENPLIVTEPPSEWIGEEIVVTDLPRMPQAPAAAPASDSCDTATPLQLSFGFPADGSGTVTNGFSQAPTDPALSCMFPTPTDPRGYRTAWHTLVAGDTGVVTITTEGTDYDTVLAVHSGSCAAPITLACSDDAAGFQSRVSFQVVRGQTYYIEVADYHPGANTTTIAQLSATLQPGGGRWFQIDTLPFGGITRHAFAREGVDMYLIGGQTNVTGIPTLSNRLLRYNVQRQQWAELSRMPGPGLSNTTAVRLQRRIFVPGGFNGNTSSYDNTHYVYDIPFDYWGKLPSIPANLLPNGRPFAWAAAAAPPNEVSYYLTGGLTSYPAFEANATPISNTYRFIPSTNSWEASVPLTTPRYAHTAAWVAVANRGLCVAGGLTSGVDENNNPTFSLLTTGECYNPASGEGWVETEDLNFPRYNAGSAIAPDGSWYIFGGVDGNGNAVPETEVYDPVFNVWRVLGGEFSLGGRPDSPARDWPRGDFFGESLYIFGGNTPIERRVISAVERLNIGTRGAYNALIPLTLQVGSDNLLARSTPLLIDVSATGNFTEPDQFYNPYYFDWPIFGRAVIWLGNVPASVNYNIALYDALKEFRAQGDPALTGPKVISIMLAPGRYYVVVERIYPKDIPDRQVQYILTLSGLR